jgi:hypothetical protein
MRGGWGVRWIEVTRHGRTIGLDAPLPLDGGGANILILGCFGRRLLCSTPIPPEHPPHPAMKRLPLAAIALAALAHAAPGLADSTEAFCTLSRHDHTIPVERGPCRFSQRQGNVAVLMGRRWAFRFSSEDQGKTYSRTNLSDGIRFRREGAYTLTVLWQQP